MPLDPGVDDAPDVRLRYGIALAKVCLGFTSSMAPADLHDIGIGEFAAISSYPSWSSAMPNDVLLMCRPCVITKVREVVVGGVTVIVAGFPALGAGTQEGFEDQTMNVASSSFATGMQQYRRVAAP